MPSVTVTPLPAGPDTPRHTVTLTLSDREYFWLMHSALWLQNGRLPANFTTHSVDVFHAIADTLSDHHGSVPWRPPYEECITLTTSEIRDYRRTRIPPNVTANRNIHNPSYLEHYPEREP